MPEIKSHTALRGIAALLVLIFHYKIMLPPRFDPSGYTHFFDRGYLWVDCFFILSGFILCYVYGTTPGETAQERSRFLIARVARIYPLHLATLVALAALEATASIIGHPVYVGNAATFLLNLFDIQAWGVLSAYDWNFPSWSISVEFAAYLLFPLICAGFVMNRRATLTLLVILLTPALSTSRDNWEQTALLHGLPMFFLGILTFHFTPPISEKSIVSIQLASTAALITVLHFGLQDLLSTPCFAALIFSTKSDVGPAKILSMAPLRALGEWSYSIYMLHIPVRILCSLFLAARLPPELLFIVAVGVTIALGAISYRFFEMPARRWLLTLKRPSYGLVVKRRDG